VLSSGSSSGTLVSNQHFSGNIDVTFNVNLTGKGESIVGLYSETSGWLTFADLHATATPELLFYSPLGPNPPAYSCTSCFGRSIGIRITVVGSLVYFYLDGNATPVAEINVTPLSDYVLYMYAGDNQYYGGANTTNFYSVVVHSGTMLEPDPSTVPTIAQFAPSSTPISGRSFDGLLSGSQFGPNIQIWFCTESNTSQCYRQPAAGVVPNADGSSVQVNAVGLSAGNWKVKARNNIGAWSNYSDSFSVLTAPPVLFSEDFSTDPSNRWIYTSGGATITFQPGELTIFEPQTYASAMYVSNQQFTSDIDVTFKLNHSGYGETLAGLFVPSTNSWLAFATISASSTFSGISFYSAGFANPPQYSCQSCSNRDITVRVKTSNGQVMFYIDGDVNPIATTGFNAPQGYALLIYADNNPYFGGANTSIFYHVEVASGTLLN